MVYTLQTQLVPTTVWFYKLDLTYARCLFDNYKECDVCRKGLITYCCTVKINITRLRGVSVSHSLVINTA